MSSTEITEYDAEQAKIIAKKREAWGHLGAATHQKEMLLIAKSLEIVKSLPDNMAIADIVTVEGLIRDAKAENALIIQTRKEVTSRFDSVTQRMMEPEKSAANSIKACSDLLIKAKQEKQKIDASTKAKIDEQAFIREHFSNQLASEDARLKGAVNGLAAKCLTFALEKDIKPETIQEQIDRYKKEAAEKRSWKHEYTDIAFAHNNQTVYDKIKKEVLSAGNNVDYVAMFNTTLDEIFSDYSVAYLNKKEAIAMNEREAAEKAQEIAAEQQNKKAAAKLESSAINIAEVETGGKALKKAYEIDMEETVKSTMLIFAAFIANQEQCLSKLKVNKWFSFTAKQAGVALGKIKCDENSFEPSGIIFKEISKL